MASIVFTAYFSNNGTPKTGLTPTFLHLKRMSDGGSIALSPTVSETDNGVYRFSYDAETNGDATCTLDGGATLANASERYVPMNLTREASRLLTALPDAAIGDSAGKVLLQATQTGVTIPTVTSVTNAPTNINGQAPPTNWNSMAIDSSGRVTVGAILASVVSSLVTQIVSGVWSAATNTLTAAGSIGKKLADWVLGADNRVEINLAQTLPVSPVAGTTGEALKNANISLPGLVAGTDGGLPIVDGTGAVPAVVQGYATDQDPAAYLLETPANKIATDSSGNVSTTGGGGGGGGGTGYGFITGDK